MFLDDIHFNLKPNAEDLFKSTHPPKILILYGSLRERSFSRLLAEEAGRILAHMGAEIKFFNSDGLPVFDNNRSVEHPKVQELINLSLWSEGQVWSSPELHGIFLVC
jgi:arsenic resistance protein ArsH